MLERLGWGAEGSGMEGGGADEGGSATTALNPIITISSPIFPV